MSTLALKLIKFFFDSPEPQFAIVVMLIPFAALTGFAIAAFTNLRYNRERLHRATSNRS